METDRRQVGWALGLVLAGAASLLLLNSSSLPLFDPDEVRFARTSVEMLRGQDPVVPRFEGEPRLVKPPLMHWVQSALFAVFGVTSSVARLHALVATLGSLLLVGWVARLRFGDEAAPWAIAVLGSMPLVVALGRLGTLDALLALHVFAAVALDLSATDPSDRYRSLALGAVLGLAFLIKGPVGVVLPLLMILAGRTFSGRRVVGRVSAFGWGLVGISLVVLPWGLAFLQRIGAEQVTTTIRVEALERYFAGHDHVEPFWFYAPVLVVGFLPWIGPLAVAVVRALGPDSRQARTVRYLAGALVVGVVFFSLGKSKLASYLLPLAPLAALLVTWQLGRELELPARRPWGSRLLAATLVLFGVALGVLAATRLEGAAVVVAWVGAAAYLLAAATAIVGLGRHRPRQVYAAAATATAIFLLATVIVFLPELSLTHSAAALVDAVPELHGSRPLVRVDMKLPSLTFYLDRVPEEVALADLGARLAEDDTPLLVFDEDDLERVAPELRRRLRAVGAQGKYVVLEKLR